MIYEGERDFDYPDSKPVFTAGLIEIDISRWLGDDTFDNVDFAAATEAGDDATSTVLAVGSCTYDSTLGLLKPYIKAGASGETYICTMEVTTAGGDQEVFTLRWSVI
jgi:hypothetical protein